MNKIELEVELAEFESSDTVICGGCMVNASGCWGLKWLIIKFL